MNTTQARSVESIRGDFPIINAPATGHIAYLDSAATSHKPRVVIDAISGYYEEANSNVHRAVHSLAAESTGRFERARSTVAKFIGANSVREIVFTRGTTESINLVASSFGQRFSAGDIVILTEMEHHSNLVPWQLLAARTGIELRFIPIDDRGVLELAALDELWTDRVRMVALTQVSNVLGTINDVRAVTDYAHERGVPVLVDAAQSVPHQRVGVDDLGCDFLAFSGHKIYGPTGIGVLYAKSPNLDQMEPYMGGGSMIEAVWLDRSTWTEAPQKFEAGTPNIAGAVGLGAAIEYVESIGIDALAAHEQEITRYAMESLATVAGLTMYGPDAPRGSVISFVIDDIHPHDVAQYLDREGVAVRPGHHCAQPLMRRLNVVAMVRASFGAYSTRQEIDRLVSALEKTKEFFAGGI